MKVKIKQQGHTALFNCSNETGQEVQLQSVLGNEERVAVSPMENLLFSVAGCSSVDVILILGKMKEPLEHLEVDIDAERTQVEECKPFSAINLTFTLTGNLNAKKVERAIKLSIEKYCSVIYSLNPNITITHSFQINN